MVRERQSDSEKENLKRLFYNRFNTRKNELRSGVKVVMESGRRTKWEAKILSSDIQAYERANRYPTETMIEELSSLFTKGEYYKLMSQGRKKKEQRQGEAPSVDTMLAISIFSDIVRKNLADCNGSYKVFVREKLQVKGIAVNSLSTNIRNAIETRSLPTETTLSKMEKVLTESEYLIIKRAILNEKERNVDVYGLDDVTLSRLMTDEERKRQRLLRKHQKELLLARLEANRQAKEKTDLTRQKN